MGMNFLFRFCVGIPRCTWNILRFSSSVKSVHLAYSVYDKAQPHLGPPVVIIHGLLGSKGNWNSLSKALNANIKRKVFCVDARNHGDSPRSPDMTYYHLAEDLRTFIRDHHLGRVAVMGHSMGGRAVMLLAVEYPELIEKLIVVDISPVGSSSSLYDIKKYIEAMKNIKFAAYMSLSAARKHADKELSSVVAEPSVRQFLITNVTEIGESVGWRVNFEALLKNYNEISTFPPTDKVFIGPTCFIAGCDSDFLRYADKSKIKETYPSAVFECISGAGHWVHSDQPSVFLSVVCKFLAGQ